jgi:SAM-dependent methyltransferase
VQLDAVVPAHEIFDDYAYLSSFSSSWVEHARRFASSAVERFALDGSSRVVEIASNDGYLLEHFIALGVPVLGVEPAKNVAEIAAAKGITTEVGYFDRDLSLDLVDRGVTADLLVANNVLAHVPDLNAFVAGFEPILAPGGVVSIEVPHLLRLIEHCQFDTIYHEHYSYFSLLSADRALSAHGLRTFDVEELPTHGGSLRIHACRLEDEREQQPSVERVLAAERAAQLDTLVGYTDFARRVASVIDAVRSFVRGLRAEGTTVVGYGAAAKANTLLNACGLGADDIDFVVDRNPLKQGRLLPGSRIPIRPPETIDDARPDVVMVLAWNLLDEIVAQLDHIRSWGGRFAVPVPEPRLLP